ncbi:C-type lectin domain family 2 member D-like isoform X2 [Elephas maximus indicus]|uniref:C-type lectin domain family 2 member D-like isoform X2 n=1 Tax=Elephas maximus indicus TaxID=99487 RepID=UPI0021169ABB|nr:C-type lectin domain family 2 member D-like isoform X2 [Elephas maximus indicus]
MILSHLCQKSGDTISSSLTTESQEPAKTNKKKFCVSKMTILISFLVILITRLAAILAVGKNRSSTEHISCLDDWIGYQRKCFYFSENTTTWASSQNFGASHAATLAVFNTMKELVSL